MRMQFRQVRKTNGVISLQDCIEIGKDGTTLTVADAIPDPFCMEEAVEREDAAAKLHRLVEKLPSRDRTIIALRYGLGGGSPLTQQQTAQALGISRSYVSRLENRVLSHLYRELAQINDGHDDKTKLE